MATLILLKRVFVQDFDEFTSQWREFLFNTLDPDGPIIENLVINSTAFELADNALIWTNPVTGDEYFWDADTDTVSKVEGSGPVIPPPLPDLSDPYGPRYIHEYIDWQQRTCRFEIYKRGYEGESEEVEGEGGNLDFSLENEGKVWEPFRGSRASLTLKSNVSRKFYDIFEADERDHYGRFLVDNVVKWTGWITPDIFNEPWKNGPFMTTLNFNDGIGGLKNLPFPDVNSNGFTGTISEKDAIIACLSRIGLRLNVHIACNLSEDGMDTLSPPIEQSFVNVEAFVSFNQGERQPLNCYEVLEKIMRSWNAFLMQEDNIWWVVREPELYAASLSYARYDADGVFIDNDTVSLERTFIGEGIKLHGSTLETKPAFTNVAVAQENGELLVENGNFAVNGNFENWTAYIVGGYQQGWRLNNWTYDKLQVFPFTSPGSLGRVRRVTESTGLDSVNNYINIYEVVRSFSDPVGRMISEPVPIRKEVGNLIQVSFKTRCNTKGSDKRLVEAYFNIAVKCGTKWLEVEGDTASWVDTERRIRWKVAEVMRWENIVLPSVEIPEDGDINVYLYQIVQVGSVSRVEYVCDYDDVEIKLVDNPALQNSRVYYKTNNPETYTSTIEELTIELGDVATVMSQNAKIVNGVPTASWKRPGDSVGQPLAKLICRELANQYQRTTYRLRGGSFYRDASRLATYEDSVNEPGRKFLLTGGDYNAKTGQWNPDFVEINQEETTVEIRVVQEAKSGREPSTGANSGGGPDGTGNVTPTPPAVPVDLGDLDDVIPIIRGGVFEDSEIRAVRNEDGEIIQYQFDKPVRGLPAVDDDEFVTLSQLPVVQRYGLVSGGAIQWSGSGLTYNFARAFLAISGEVTAESGQVTLDAADPTNPRFDGLGWEKISELIADRIKITGVPSATPAFPSFNPENQVEGIFVLVPASATTPPGITTENVYLDNAPEWAVSFAGIGTGNADSTADPKEGTKAIETSAIRNAFKIILDRGSVLDLNTFTDPTLGWDQKLKSTLGNNQNFDIIFLDGSGNPASNLLQVALNKASLAYQFIGINLDAFTFTTKLVRYIEIRYRQNGSGTFLGAFFDNIKIQGGVAQPPSPGGGQGEKGWSPILAVVTDGARRVLQVSDWTGGAGSKPSTGQYIGATGLTATIGDAIDIRGAAGADGDDGREVEFRNNGTHIQWRYVGEGSWIDLVALSDITGDDGVPIELQVSGDWLQWRYVGAGSWTNLFDLTTLGGGGGTDTNAVHYNVADGKTASEKQQARDNIGSTAGIPQIVSTTGTINDLAITSNCIIFTGAGGLILNGIAAGSDGEEVSLINASGSNITINANNAGSSINNRFQNAQIIPNLSWIVIKYRTTTNKWIVEGAGNFVSLNIEDTKLAKFNISSAGTVGATGPLNVNETTASANAPIVRVLSNNIFKAGFFGNSFQSQYPTNSFTGAGTPGGAGVLNIVDNSGNVNSTSFSLTLQPGTVVRFFNNGVLWHVRSTGPNASLIRSEQLLLYPVTVTTAGTINDQAETAGNFNYNFTAATQINGFASGENGKVKVIHNKNTVDLILAHENAGSVAANRLTIIGAANLTVPPGGIVELIYEAGTVNRWRLKSKNF